MEGMYQYKLDEDGYTVITASIEEGQPLDDGWEILPAEYNHVAVWWDGEKLTDTPPQAAIDEMEIRRKISKRVLELAVDDLKKKGEIPSNYKLKLK